MGSFNRLCSASLFIMGRVRTKTVKKASRLIIERYYPRLTTDFHTNKRICEEVALIPSKRLRNKVSGFVTHLMRRIAKGPVRGISFKLQEEERERKDNFVPEFSQVNTSRVEVDVDTMAMLRSMNLGKLPNIEVVSATSGHSGRGFNKRH